MLTPRFKLSQDDHHVFITVHAPYTNVGEAEIDVDEHNFLFVSSPYFLRLRLPGKIVENDSSRGSYLCDSGEFNFTFDKARPGEHFENLDMITSLLAPREIPDVNPVLVQMLEEDRIDIEEDSTDSDDVNNKYAYGFANKVTSEFSDIGSEFPQIFELRVPERVAVNERHALRISHEQNKFSSDHYLADLYDEELIQPYLISKPFWNNTDSKDSDFSEEEVTLLKELPNKHYLLNKNEYRQVLLGLVDILFGYCYDKRTTLNESTVESSWTINKLSATLCWFCTFSDMKHVLVTCYRRALIYPIFRNFDLCEKVKKDVVSLLKTGKKLVVKALIEIHQMFNTSNDARYILNQLYIKDYLVFIQKCRNEELDELHNNIANIELVKKDLDLELDELEAAAKIVEKEEIDIVENEMAVKLASMSLIPGLKKSNVEYLNKSDSNSSTDSSSDASSDDSSELDSDDESCNSNS